MFNYANVATYWRPGRVLGGLHRSDSDSFTTLYAGPDPAEPSRILVRKILQVNEKAYAYEETRISPMKNGDLPQVHTVVTKLGDMDLREEVSKKEYAIRQTHRALPNVVGFSQYYRKTGANQRGFGHVSIVENTLWKSTGCSWAELWQTFQDRRDISRYLRKRWNEN